MIAYRFRQYSHDEQKKKGWTPCHFSDRKKFELIVKSEKTTVYFDM